MSKETYCILASFMLILAGMGFGVAGFLTPPPGEISDGVLILIAQCFVMAGSFVGIDAILLGHRSNNLKKQNDNGKNENRLEESN